MQWCGRAAWVCLAIAAAMARAQGPIGTVSTADATVANNGEGVIEASAGRALVRGSGTVTARDHTAKVQLTRGGEVRVCRSTGVHLTSAKNDSLLVGLDRGAMEISMKVKLGDVVMTPDLVLAMGEAGPLDLEMRVTTNGDTCVENRGISAPLLKITDAFGEATYELKAGQHVLFEHGSLREVVDAETTPCGCPPDEAPSQNLADTLLSGGGTGPVTPAQAAQAHPFPAAVSEGLADPAPITPAAKGERHVQVATTLAYDAKAESPAPAKPPAAKPDKAVVATTTSAKAPTPRAEKAASTPQKQPGGGPFRAVGRFFKHMFAR